MPNVHLKKQLFIVIVLVASACSIKPPEVRLTGEKTALEKEILGTYHQMREDTWMVASTRGVEEKPQEAMSPEKSARSRRSANRSSTGTTWKNSRKTDTWVRPTRRRSLSGLRKN